MAYSPASVIGNIGINPQYADNYWKDQIAGAVQQQAASGLGDYSKMANMKALQAEPTISSTAERNLVLTRDATNSLSQIEFILFGPSPSDPTADYAYCPKEIVTATAPIKSTVIDTKLELEAITSRLEAIIRQLGGR